MTNPLLQLQQLGQSPWLDNIRRAHLASGALHRMVQAGDITGLTSNPTIFEQAIARSSDYDEAIAALARQGKTAEQIFDVLAIEDIRAAADEFAPVYQRTGGADGFVSIEVAPRYAHDTAGTIKEAQRLWKAVRRPNLMVKIPATLEGLPAIERCLAEGINVNITLIFALERYAAVIEAFMAGLEARRGRRKKVSAVASVASFFVSRVDTLVDKQLDERIAALGKKRSGALLRLRGQAAIANAKLAYALFRDRFGGERFAALAAAGARPQRPLWASTSTKDPAYPDVYYVEALIGPDTVNTLPPATLEAYKDHGQPAVRIDQGADAAARVIEQLEEAGINMQAVTDKLEADGVRSFAASFDSLIAVVDARREALLHADRTTARLPAKVAGQERAAAEALQAANFGPRLWAKAATLWKPDAPGHQAEIANRLGWLTSPALMLQRASEMTTFAGEVRRAGFTHALLCGMGGSSLAPEVLRETFGVRKGWLDLAVLDSTDPAAVLAAEARSDPARTLYIIASKSGGTTEPNAFFAYFWERVRAMKGGRAGENFVAITDPGTAMEKRAADHAFRRAFLNPPDIGGRYAALSYFGILPAALMGIDIARLLARAQAMVSACAPIIPPADNPGLRLGALLGGLALAGRDKLTLFAAPGIKTFSYWVEQLVAESTGKEGLGILPVEGERLGGPEVYARQRDRLFVHLRLDGPRTALDRGLDALAAAGQPVLELRLQDAYDLGGEFLRWEIATAAASHLLGINPFDQPNVQESKDNTVRLLAEHAAAQGEAPAHGVSPHGGVPAHGSAALTPAAREFPTRLLRHLKQARRGDYVALLAYFHRTPVRERLLRQLQAAIRDRFGVAVTVGYGPRFLHSTGQLHKGGPNSGVFIQFTANNMVDAHVPGEAYSFGALQAAQALGDLQALETHGRRAVRVDLGSNVQAGLRQALEVMRSAAAVGGPRARANGRKHAGARANGNGNGNTSG